MKTFAELTSLPEAWGFLKLFMSLMAGCLLADLVAKRFSRQVPKGGAAWNPKGSKLRLMVDRFSVPKN